MREESQKRNVTIVGALSWRPKLAKNRAILQGWSIHADRTFGQYTRANFSRLEPCGLALRHSTGVEFLGDRFEVSERLGDGERIHFLTKAITGL